MLRSVPGVIAGVCLVALSAGHAVSQPQKKDHPAAEILSPKVGGEVDRVLDVSGKLQGAGWPVVLVRPRIKGGIHPYYVQPFVDSLGKGGMFTTTIYVGDKDTPAMTKFEIVVLVADNKAAAEKFVEGKTLTRLPEGVARSESVEVARRKE